MKWVPTNGGSYRFIVGGKNTKAVVPFTPHLWGYPEWKTFGARILKLKDEACDLLSSLNAQGKTVLGVGASTKANTVLQFYGLTTDHIRAIVEIAPEKIGKETAGTWIPIVDEATAEKMNPDFYVALAWQFLDGLRARTPHTPFITLLPEVRFHPPYESEHAGLTA
jgi:hypothetical protein